MKWLFKTIICFVITFVSIKKELLAQDLRTIQKVDSQYVDAQINAVKISVEKGALASAEALANQLLKECASEKFQYGVIKSLVGLGNIAVHKGDFAKALEIYNKALENNAFNSAKDVQPTIYANIGNICAIRGDYSSSAKFYELAIEAADRTGSTNYTPMLYANLSVSYHVLMQYDKAIMMLNKAEKMALNANNYLLLAEIYIYKGLSYTELKDYIKSDSYFDQAIHIAQNRGFSHLLFTAYTSRGNAYLVRGDHEQALKNFKQAEIVGKDITGFRRSVMMIGLAKTLIQLNNYAVAKPILIATLAQAQQIENKKDQVTIHSLLATVYQQSARYDSAFFHRTLEMNLNDSLKKNETTFAIAEIENQHKAALKATKLTESQLTIAKQQFELSKRNNWIFFILFILILLSLFIRYQKRVFAQKQKIKSQEINDVLQQQKIIEMKALLEGEEKERERLAREIHDDIMVQFSIIKMGLSAWLGQSKEDRKIEDIRSTMQQLDNTTENLRRTAHNLMPDVLWDEGLVDAIYFFFDNLQKSVPIQFNFQPVGNIPKFDPSFELNIYRIIQELIQNVIKHAKATEVLVQLSFDESMLGITVEDNGIGLANEKLNAGMGLKSIVNRINSFEGNIEFDSKPNVGTSINIQFDNLQLMRIR